MTRPAPRRLAACLLTGLLMLLLPLAVPATAAPASGRTPLRVSMDTLTPSTLPTRPHARITVTGQVTNRSDQTWTNLDIFLFTSSTPMRTSEALDRAARTDPTALVGARLTGPGLYDTVDSLAPGQSADYVLSVERKDLRISGQPGVYWFGVHVLGTNRDGRDAVADGRARTFMPLMSADGPHTDLSLMMPLKAPVHRDSTGRLVTPDRWARLLEGDGRLGRLVQMSANAAPAQVTWVLDPAVANAARSVVAGNPATSTAPSPDLSQQGNGSPSPSPSPASPSPSQSPPDQGTGAPAETAPPTGPKGVARQWLADFREAATSHAVRTVPYGDLDVASALRHGRTGLYRRAVTLSKRTADRLGIQAAPVVAPDSGYLPRQAMRRLGKDTTVLLSDRAMPSAVSPVENAPQGPRVILADSSAGAGGPGPTRRWDALAVRQRILSAAAVHALSPDRAQPLVVSTPPTWDPGADWQLADFFPGLAVSWVDPVSLPAVPFVTQQVPGNAPQGPPSLVYPKRLRRSEIPEANLRASHGLMQAGDTLADLLSQNDTVDEELARQAMLASSTYARPHPGRAASRARQATRHVHRLLGKVRIDGPEFVTMSSEEGTITVTLINGLDEPVTVGVKADTGPGHLVITAPDPVDIPPGQRASVRLHARAGDVGVHSVKLVPVTPAGHALSNVTRFNVRSNHLGLVIWVIMGVGAAFLVVTAAVRAVRRIRVRKATHGPLLRRNRP